MIKIGFKFPDFSLPDQNGASHTLSQYTEKWLIIYFYPRDNTSGCSLEASNFAGLIKKYATRNTNVIGVSADSVKSHAKFAERMALPFTLLSDAEHSLSEAGGTWQKKTIAGKEYMGIVRSTYILDPQSVVRASWTRVKIDGHAEEVLAKTQRTPGIRQLKYLGDVFDNGNLPLYGCI